MEKHATSREWIAGMAYKWSMLGGACWILGLIFAVIGIIGEVTDSTLVLTPISWFLLAIASFVASVSWHLGWAMSLYLRVTEAKKEQ